MRKWSIACSAAVLAIGIAAPSHADEWNKLTLLTFSGPVEMPGITLPAGTYRFELADPDSGRRVVRVSDQDGSKIHGTFLSISNQKMEPSDEPVVMFQESPAGAPQAVKAWFYPGETYGYEFVYPHDQAMKIASATHQPVMSMKDESSPTTTDAERVASMRGAEVGRIDENGRPVSADAELKESSSQRVASSASAEAPVATPSTASNPGISQSSGATPATTAQSATTSQSASTASTSTSTASTTASTASPSASTTSSAATSPSTAAATTSPSTSRRAAPASASRSTTAAPTAVGTSGTADRSAAGGRDALPRTASELPTIALLGMLALAASLGLRAARTV